MDLTAPQQPAVQHMPSLQVAYDVALVTSTDAALLPPIPSRHPTRRSSARSRPGSSATAMNVVSRLFGWQHAAARCLHAHHFQTSCSVKAGSSICYKRQLRKSPCLTQSPTLSSTCPHAADELRLQVDARQQEAQWLRAERLKLKRLLADYQEDSWQNQACVAFARDLHAYFEQGYGLAPPGTDGAIVPARWRAAQPLNRRT